MATTTGCGLTCRLKVVAPGAKRLVVLHLAVEGSFRITLPTSETALVETGEAVVLPYCDVHSMGSPEIAHPVPVATLLPKPPWTELPVVARIDGRRFVADRDHERVVGRAAMPAACREQRDDRDSVNAW